MDHAPEALRVRLLGGFSVGVGSRTIGQDEWRLRRAAALIKLLALAPNHRLHREQIMELLWPHLGRRAASNNLRRTLHATRRVLDPSESSRYLASEEGWLALCPAGALRVAVGFQHIPEEDAWREPYLAAARSRLDEASWAEAWVEGRTMSMEQAIEYALSEQKPATPPSLESEQSSSDGPSNLTRREKEIAILVSRGLTNRQIAKELFLSEHTVHHHVTNILKKLNVSSRQQVASDPPDR